MMMMSMNDNNSDYDRCDGKDNNDGDEDDNDEDGGDDHESSLILQ